MTEREKTIYSKLQDDLSRYIFRKRIEYRDSRDINCIEDIVNKSLPQYHGYILEKADQKVLELISIIKDYPIVLFGAGKRGGKIYNRLIQGGVCVVAIVDNYADGLFTGNHEITIARPDSIDYKGKKVIITPLGYELKSIYSQLIQMGVEKKDIYKYDDFEVSFYCDDKNQYFDEDIVKVNDGEVFVDGGVYDLNSSRYFSEYCLKNGVNDYYIFGFEADRDNYEKCNLRLQNEYSFLDKHIELMNLGLWDKKERVFFFNNPEGSSSSRISESEANACCDTVPLDNYFDCKISFIKMDIEGAELKGLEGAKNVIKKYRPKLAICVYHKPEDITEIPEFILSLVPEYRLFLRHYSNSFCETILYAVI